VRAGRLEGPARLDPDLVRSALVELAPLVVLGGVVEGTDLRGELLSYQVPSYFRMLCAAFAPTEEARDP
jgi:aromatic ring-opening dioxygenase LigB subunit